MGRLAERDLKQFGQNVVSLRHRRRMTQEEMAEAVGVSARYFQSIEAGRRWPSIRVLGRLRTALRCQWTELLAGVGGEG